MVLAGELVLGHAAVRFREMPHALEQCRDECLVDPREGAIAAARGPFRETAIELVAEHEADQREQRPAKSKSKAKGGGRDGDSVARR